MPILDLVTPWAAAAESPDALATFTNRHHELLEAMRRQRAPAAESLGQLPAYQRLDGVDVERVARVLRGRLLRHGISS